MSKSSFMKKKIKELTRAEEQIMQILWDMDKGFVKEMIARMEAPKPAYSTVSTIVRILVKKGFIGYKVYGNTYEYYPLISREAYKKFEAERLLSSYFDDSVESLVSFFVSKKKLNMSEAGKIISILEDLKNDKS